MISQLILDNIKKIRLRLARAASRSGRKASDIAVVAVVKYASPEQIRRVLESGLIQEMGENRVQDAQARRDALGELGRRARWRMIGHLQTNKARQAVELFGALDSLDSFKLAQALEKNISATGRRMSVLVQVKLSGKETQSGVLPEDLDVFLGGLKAFPHLDAQGLMGIAPMEGDVEASRPHFQRLRGLFDKFFAGRTDARLSMGMSRDFDVAVEEGATMVRIGSAIFAHASQGGIQP